MQVVILCSEAQQSEFMSTGTNNNANFIWVKKLEELTLLKNADVFIDLLFEKDAERIMLLESLLPATVIVNSVVHSLETIHSSFIRINGWPTFLSSQLIEAACVDIEKKEIVEQVVASFNKKIEWVPDVPGFITPRIVGTIINEAYFALADGVSTKEEIDTAMKLGTAYPYGPLEWMQKIGVKNIVMLLQTLSVTQPRYTPAELLVQENSNAI